MVRNSFPQEFLGPRTFSSIYSGELINSLASAARHITKVVSIVPRPTYDNLSHTIRYLREYVVDHKSLVFKRTTSGVTFLSSNNKHSSKHRVLGKAK